MTHRRAFTVLELLVVIAIIGILTAVLYPVLIGARKKSKDVVCISNLRQCGVALRLYMNDYATELPPDDQMAHELLKKMPTCCPNDKEWTKGCTLTFGKPLIGSYAYTRSVPGIERLSEKTLSEFYSPEQHDVIWMADIFHPLTVFPLPYYAERESAMEYGKRVKSDRNLMPDGYLKLYSDGHVERCNQFPYRPGIGALNIGFMWSTIFCFPVGYTTELPAPDASKKNLPPELRMEPR